MDYAKMLFAYHVRDLSVKRMALRTKNMMPEEKERYEVENYNTVVKEAVDEIAIFASVIDEHARSKDSVSTPYAETRVMPD